jgi:hypothetical protein
VVEVPVSEMEEEVGRISVEMLMLTAMVRQKGRH